MEALLKELFELEMKLIRGNLSVKQRIDEIVVVFEENEYLRGIINGYNILSTYHKYQQELSKAMEFSDRALHLAKSAKDKALLGKVLNYRGGLYARVGNRKAMSDCYVGCLEIFDALNMPKKKYATLSNLGSAYVMLKELTLAEKYLLEAFEIAQFLPDKQELWLAPKNLVDLYITKMDFDKAKKYVEICFDAATESNHQIGLSFAYRGFAACLAHDGNYQLAIEELNKAQKIIEATGVLNILDSLIFTKAEYLIADNQEQKAIELINSRLPLIKQEKNFQTAHGCLHQAYLKGSNFEKALEHLRLEDEYKSNLEGVEMKKHLYATEAKYQNKLKESEKKILSLQKVEMEQKALRAQLNPHFFLKSLKSIEQFIEGENILKASSYLMKFGGLMRKTLENSDVSLITVEDEVSFLTDYLTLEQMRLNNCFQFKIEVDSEMETDFCKLPTMLIQPFIESAIEYGLSGLVNKNITVSFSSTEKNKILCVVSDDGRNRQNSTDNLLNSSLGTRLIEQRLKSFETIYKEPFLLHIDDLKNEQGNPSGTRIKLLIPDLSNFS